MSGKFWIALWALIWAAAAPSQNVSMIDSIVAVVNDDIILRSEFERSLATVVRQFAAANQPLPSRNVLERRVLDQLVLIKLQLQQAEARNIETGDEELERAIQRVAAQSGITPEQMRMAIERDGLSWAQFREELRDELKVQRLQRAMSNSRVNITETEIDIFLATQGTDNNEYRISHILVGVPEGASPEQIQQARQQSDAVYQEITEGLDFATAAISYSSGQAALDGGDIGWRGSDQMPTILADQIQGMQVGDVTRPLRNASGFHIFKLTDQREVTQQLVDEVNARHILIEVNELVASQEALEIISNLHERLLEGEEFSTLAKQYSDDKSSANLGGEMGWFQPGAYGTRVQQVLTTLDDGEISQPFQSSIGWHLLQKLGERRQDRTDEIRRLQARESIRRQKAGEELYLWQRELVDEAYVEYRI